MRDGALRSLAVLSLRVDGRRRITLEGGVAIELHWPHGRREWFVLVGVAGTTEPFDDDRHDVTLETDGPTLTGRARLASHHLVPDATAIEVRFAGLPSESWDANGVREPGVAEHPPRAAPSRSHRCR